MAFACRSILVMNLLIGVCAFGVETSFRDELKELLSCMDRSASSARDQRREVARPYRTAMRKVCSWCTLMDPDLFPGEEPPTSDAIVKEGIIHAKDKYGEALMPEEKAYLVQRKKEFDARKSHIYLKALETEDIVEKWRPIVNAILEFDGVKQPFLYAKTASRYLVEKPKVNSAEGLANLSILLRDTEIPRLEKELQRLNLLKKRRVPLDGLSIGKALHNDPKAIRQYGTSDESIELYFRDWISRTTSEYGTGALNEVKRQIQLDKLIIEASLRFRGVKKIAELDALCNFEPNDSARRPPPKAPPFSNSSP